MKKKIKFLFVVFLLSCFLPPVVLFSDPLEDTSMESGAIQKKRGLTEKKRDSINIIRQRLIKNIEMGNIEKIRIYLRNYGNNINFIVNNSNPFVQEVNVNNLELVEFFLKETQIKIDAKDGSGNTALFKACDKGHIEIANLLINNGADVNFQNKEGTTPAMKAAENNHFYVLQLLLEKNIDKSRSDYTGRTLREIAENSRDKRILKLLN